MKMTTYWVLDKNEFDSGNIDPSTRNSFDEGSSSAGEKPTVDKKRGQLSSTNYILGFLSVFTFLDSWDNNPPQ